MVPRRNGGRVLCVTVVVLCNRSEPLNALAYRVTVTRRPIRRGDSSSGEYLAVTKVKGKVSGLRSQSSRSHALVTIRVASRLSGTITQKAINHCIKTKKNSSQIRAPNNRPLADDQKDINHQSSINIQTLRSTPLSNFNSSAAVEAEHTSDRPSYPPEPLCHTLPHRHQTPEDPSANPTTADSVVHARPDRTPSHTLHAHTLVPSPSRVLSRAAPARPVRKTPRYSAEAPTRAACASPPTSW